MDQITSREQARAVSAAVEFATPASEECVFCYVDRMLGRFGCDSTLRWAQRWRDDRMPFEWPLTRPPCTGSATSQPCGNWVPRRRDHW